MTRIFGFVRRDGAPVAPSAVATLREASSRGSASTHEWSQGGAALGQTHTSERLAPAVRAPSLYDRARGFAFTATARLDNRDQLIRELGLLSAGSRDETNDRDLLLAAYQRWGDAAPSRVLGDWALAAWHPRERRLFLARDHFGHSSLYYHASPDVFAFASSPRPLRNLGLVPPALDELYLAQYLISWMAYQGERTIDHSIRRLPPAHMLAVTPERLDVRCYWRMEEVSELRLRHRSEYVGAFREMFDQAVSSRLGSYDGVGVTLSGGLDSGAVAATAALVLNGRGAALPAFTWVPLADTTPYVGNRIGDELSLALATAAASGKIDVRAFSSEGVSPIEGVRRSLAIFDEPIHAAGNAFWLLDVLELAKRSQCEVLLTGQLGNAGTSWPGDPLSQPLAHQIRRLGAKPWLKARVKRALPRPVLVHRAQRKLGTEWYRGSAIHPDLARRVDLAERRLADPDTFPTSPLQTRLSILKPGRSLTGALWAQLGSELGVDVRDPTADVRLIEFALSVPDRVFIDPVSSQDRWVIREAMRGRLPDEVRLNRRRGIQAGDLVPRLRACRGEVERALDELAGGPAVAYLDVPYMREVWLAIQLQDTAEAFRKAVTVLTRGIMAGLCVNSLSERATAA